MCVHPETANNSQQQRGTIKIIALVIAIWVLHLGYLCVDGGAAVLGRHLVVLLVRAYFHAGESRAFWPP